MAIIGIILGLIGAAVGIVVCAVGGLVGMVLGLLGGAIGLLPVLFPVLLMTLGIFWLLKGSNARNVTEVRADGCRPAPPHSPGNPR